MLLKLLYMDARRLATGQMSWFWMEFGMNGTERMASFYALQILSL